MGEAARKPNSFELTVKNTERYVVFTALTQTLKCPACKTGPLDTTDPIKFMKFVKLWNSFKLSDFEDLNQTALIELISDKETQTITVETEVLRFIVDSILMLSSNLTTFAPVISLLNKLTAIALENKIKISDYTDEASPELVQVSLTNEDVKLLIAILLSPRRCENQFELNNGTTVPHGAALDHPKTVREYATFNKTITQLNALDILTGEKQYEDFEGVKSFDLNTETMKYLKNLVSARSTSTNLPASKFIKVFSKLEEVAN